MSWLLDWLRYWVWHRPMCRVMGVQPRSSKWPAKERQWLKDHPQCEATGSRIHLNVHHKVPFHKQPELELDDNNLVTVRRDVHLLIGHWNNWKSYNPNIDSDLLYLKIKIDNRPS